MYDYFGLNAEPIKWTPKSKPRSNASKNHKKALEIVRQLLPMVHIYEECKLPLGIKKNIYIDIFIPSFSLAIEIDGRQHSEFNKHFHRDKLSFYRAQKNDRLKEEWCEVNNINIIRLKEQDARNWRKQIEAAI